MAINKKLISFATQAQFDLKLNAGDIDNRSIVFIEDKKRIWTHGVYFDTSWDYITGTPDTLAGYNIIDAASKINSLYYVVGNTTGTAGAWTGTVSEVTSLYEGLTIAYRIGVAGASTTNLNLNGLGNKLVRRATGNLTTHLPVGTIVLLTYDGTRWVWADYDSSTTYAAMSVDEGKAGTVSTLRTMRADYLKQIIEHHITNTVPSAHTLGSHSDVTITSIASGEILKWNGTAWINNTLAEAGIASTGQLNNYLPLAGGTLTGSSYNMLELKRSSTNGSSMLFSNSSGNLGKIGFTSNGNLIIGTGASTDGVANLLQITSTGVITAYGNINATGKTITATTFSGNASSASAVLTSAENTGTTSRYILFADKASDNQALKTNTGLKYVPSTNTISATFSGNLTGNVTGNITATTGSFSSTLSAGDVDVDRLILPNGFSVDTDSTGIIFKSSNSIKQSFYNNGNIAANAFLGNLSGNADSASRLTTFDGVFNANHIIGGASFNYGDPASWINAPSGMSFGLIGNIISDPYNPISLQIAADINHDSTSSTKDLWFRTSNYVGFLNDWKKVWHSGNLANGSTSQYIRGDGSLATYKDTTYSAMSVAEGQAGTVTTLRTMRADYLKQIIQHYTGAYSSRANGSGASSNSIEVIDTRSINPLPNTDLQRGVWFDFKTNSAIGLTGASTYSSVITMVPYGDNTGNSNTSFRLAQSGNNLYFQNWTTVWGTWNKIWHSGNLANGTTAQYIRGDGSLATYANTTYSAGTLALLQAGANTSNRVWSAKILNDFTDGKYLQLSGGTLTGALAINLGTSGSSPLSLTSSGVTTSIGSLNATWCHFNTTATTGFYFYKNIQTPLNITANSFIGSLTGNASTATTATNLSGGTVSATTGSFSDTLRLTKNTPSGTGYSALAMEVRSSDGHPVGIGFHRGGYTQTILSHEGSGLVVRSSTISTGALAPITASTFVGALSGNINNYVEKLTTTTGAIDLNSGNVFHRDATANTTFSITNAKAGAHSFTLIITMGATVRTLTFPTSVKWQDGEVPNMTKANKTYILTFMTINSGTTWFGMEGGSF